MSNYNRYVVRYHVSGREKDTYIVSDQRRVVGPLSVAQDHDKHDRWRGECSHKRPSTTRLHVDMYITAHVYDISVTLYSARRYGMENQAKATYLAETLYTTRAIEIVATAKRSHPNANTSRICN